METCVTWEGDSLLITRRDLEVKSLETGPNLHQLLIVQPWREHLTSLVLLFPNHTTAIITAAAL